MSMSRRPVIAVAVVAVLTLTLFASALPRSQRVRAAVAPFGVASVATMVSDSPQGYADEARAIRDAGAGWIRIVVQWHKIEPARGDYDWSTGDNAVQAARAAGLNILMCIAGPAPVWAQSPGADPQAIGNPPADPAAFGEITRLIADRYKASVGTWEIWNEPNVPEFFTPVDVGRYAALLRQAYVSIHAAAPKSIVMSGGLSSATHGIESVDFVRQLYAAGAGDMLDAIALHPYTYPYPITEDPLGRGDAVLQVHQLMAAHGAGHKKIWITEYGQATGSSQYAVPGDRQAGILVDFLKWASALDYLGPPFLFTTRDLGTDPSYLDFNYGLYTVDYTPKPSVAAIKVWAQS
jgi:polysaccharide biosynthesis protein PslG